MVAFTSTIFYKFCPTSAVGVEGRGCFALLEVGYGGYFCGVGLIEAKHQSINHTPFTHLLSGYVSYKSTPNST